MEHEPAPRAARHHSGTSTAEQGLHVRCYRTVTACELLAAPVLGRRRQRAAAFEPRSTGDGAKAEPPAPTRRRCPATATFSARALLSHVLWARRGAMRRSSWAWFWDGRGEAQLHLLEHPRARRGASPRPVRGVARALARPDGRAPGEGRLVAVWLPNDRAAIRAVLARLHPELTQESRASLSEALFVAHAAQRSGSQCFCACCVDRRRQMLKSGET